MAQWPPPGDSRKVPRRQPDGEYSVPNPRPRIPTGPQPTVEPEPEVLSPAEISTVAEIVRSLRVELIQELRTVLAPAVAQPELSAALTLSNASLRRWKKVVAPILALVGALAGAVGTKAAVAPSEAVTVEVVDRVDALEERFARIERKLDRLLPP